MFTDIIITIRIFSLSDRDPRHHHDQHWDCFEYFGENIVKVNSVKVKGHTEETATVACKLTGLS